MHLRTVVQIWNQMDNYSKSRLADIEIKRAVISKLTNHFSRRLEQPLQILTRDNYRLQKTYDRLDQEFSFSWCDLSSSWKWEKRFRILQPQTTTVHAREVFLSLTEQHKTNRREDNVETTKGTEGLLKPLSILRKALHKCTPCIDKLFVSFGRIKTITNRDLNRECLRQSMVPVFPFVFAIDTGMRCHNKGETERV